APGGTLMRRRVRVGVIVAAATIVVSSGSAFGAPVVLDRTFSGDGVEVTRIGSTASAAGVVVQSDDRIVAAGSGAGRKFCVVRYEPGGGLDPTFGGDGVVCTAVGSDDLVADLSLRSDGKIVVLGYAVFQGHGGFALVRYRRDGSLDPTFGDGGIVFTEIG